MTGAMAGSTVMTHHRRSDRLKVITLTVNNSCNLSCPHCYLQYDGPPTRLDRHMLQAVVDSHAEHVAIVGKEPLVDSASTDLTEEVISRCAAAGKSTSIITNGLGLHRLSSLSLATLTWIDVSLDGGRVTYSDYRRGKFEKIIRNVNNATLAGARAINAMHTISTRNLAHVDDMVSVSELAEWDRIIFSPYVEVRNHGVNPTSPVDLMTLLEALARSRPFRSTHQTTLLLGKDSFSEQGWTDAIVAKLIAAANLTSKVTQVTHDPLKLGYIRATYDGYVMTPAQSLHPKDYRSFAKLFPETASMDAAFQELAAA
ncbi:MAG: radical SAM protein [Phenylobacterium sp.]|nr:MAG: radical SAM protein [Phenylobacterium sp.]